MNEQVEIANYAGYIINDSHEAIRYQIESWILEQRPMILSPGELHEVKKRELTIPEWDMLEDKRDYWPIRMAKGMTREQSLRFGRFIPSAMGNQEEFKRYMHLQSTWAKVGNQIFEQKYGFWPNHNAQAKIVDDFADEFRVFYVLKEKALNQQIEYSWSENLRRR